MTNKPLKMKWTTIPLLAVMLWPAGSPAQAADKCTSDACLACVSDRWPNTLPNERGTPANVAEAEEKAARELAAMQASTERGLKTFIERMARRRAECAAVSTCTPGPDISESMRQQAADALIGKRETGERQVEYAWTNARRSHAQCAEISREKAKGAT